HQRDFDFVDENALSSLLMLEKGSFRNLSGQSYRTVLIPSASSISKLALERLQSFAASGGQVIFIGQEPSLIIEKTFLNATGPADLSWAIREPSGELTPQVIEALPQPDVRLEQPCPSLKYIHRRLCDADLYFFFNECAENQLHHAILAGRGHAQVWDAMTGKIEVMNSTSLGNGLIKLMFELEPYETKFIVIGAVPSGL
ncbi:MAG TPA: glycosyl hydrolase, partial [Bacteroidales bacterium]|nr:glycosyl hydrolase [Bacteroidales bacterium]